MSKTQNVIAATKIFKLLSGVECEISKIKTKHQGILTEQGGDVTEAFNTILADCVVRVGSNRSIDRQFVEQMTSKDKKIALIELRKFSLGEKMMVEYEYLSTRTKRKAIEQVEIDIDECTVSTPYKIFSDDNSLVDVEYSEYSEIKREFITVLPNGLKVVVRLQDGASEREVAAIKKSKLDINAQFKLSRCRKLVVMGDAQKELPIELRIQDIEELEDSEHLRQFIRSIEATCITEVDFGHPENESIVTIDFMGSVNFLFPTGVK